MEYCQNCNTLIDCDCQKVIASDGKEICDECFDRYEASLKIKACANNMRSYLKENNQEENHCVILYVFDNYESGFKVVNKIYKNVDDFELKVHDHIKEIDPMLGIDFQLWIFD